MHYPAFGPTVQVLSTYGLAGSTVVLSAKVNCRTWVTVHFALGTDVLRNRVSLGIHVHTPDRHGRLILNKYIHGEISIETQIINVINFQIP